MTTPLVSRRFFLGRVSHNADPRRAPARHTSSVTHRFLEALALDIAHRRPRFPGISGLQSGATRARRRTRRAKGVPPVSEHRRGHGDELILEFGDRGAIAVPPYEVKLGGQRLVRCDRLGRVTAQAAPTEP